MEPISKAGDSERYKRGLFVQEPIPRKWNNYFQALQFSNVPSSIYLNMHDSYLTFFLV